MKKYFLFIIFLVCDTTLFAQKITLNDDATLEPVDNAVLFNSDKSKSVSTNAAGEADISTFSAGELITIQHSSFLTVSMTKAEMEKKNYNISIDKKVVMLKEVVLSANRSENNK